MDFVNIIFALIGIGLLIFVHEGGHFLAARFAGVRVEVFSLGFGPRLCGFRWRDTDFRLSAVPFGGYVLAAGVEPSDRRYPASESLWAKKVWQRALFWSGGVIMNVLFALLVFPLVFSAGVNFTAPLVGRVQHGSAAWEAGLLPGDRVVAVAGHEVRSLDTLAVEIALHGHRPVDLTIERDGETQVVTVLPHFDKQSGLYRLGVEPAYGEFELTVAPDGPAAAAGLANGDVLLQIDGAAAAGEAIATALDAGGPLSFEVRRGERTITGEIPAPRAGEPAPPLVGITMLARKVIGLRRTDWLDRLGLERGDTILAIDGRPFLGGDLAAFATGPEELRLQVVRDGREVDLGVRVRAAERGSLADRVALGVDDSRRIVPSPGHAAELAGVRAGDLIEAIDGRPIGSWDDVREIVRASAGEPLRFRLRRLPPESDAFFDPAERDLPRGDVLELVVSAERAPVYDYGMTPAAPLIEQELRATGFLDALRLGTVCSFDLLKQSYVTLKRLITGDVGAKNLGGFIRITQVSYQAAKRGPSWFWYFLALISVNLAFVNLLPIPVLDGGHLLFLAIEKVKGSPVSARVFGYSQVVGLVFVLLLVLFVTYNDILRLL
ncbi:MAG: site-2 protease family protein [Planctomycetes bacterium]|nr:site-2 protease family protein [Planctomycetota bacterium]